MQFLCKRKISIHSSTKAHEYPTVRLPREFKALAGETARIYQSQNADKLVFSVVIDKKVDNFCTNLHENNIEDQLFNLEFEIAYLKSSIFNNESFKDSHNKKRAQKNGLGRIRTGDLRHVKATS